MQNCSLLLKLDIELKKRYYSPFYKRIHKSRRKNQQNGYLLFVVRSLEDCLANTKDVLLLVWLNFLDFIQGMNDVGFCKIVVSCTYYFSRCVRARVCGKHIFFIRFLGLLIACCLSHSYHSLLSRLLEVRCFEFINDEKLRGTQIFQCCLSSSQFDKTKRSNISFLISSCNALLKWSNNSHFLMQRK